MMIRIFLSFVFIPFLLLAATNNIDKKIDKNKKILSKNKYQKKQASIKVKELANKIEKQNKNIIKLEKDIKNINKDIEKHTQLLEESKTKLEELKSTSSKLIKQKRTKEEEIVDTIIDEFSTSIALKLASENSLQELVDNEVYTLLSQHSKDKILKLNNNYNIVSSNTKDNKLNIKKISSYIKKRQKTKKTLNSLKKKHSKSLVDLEQQHKSYQQELTKVINQQKSLKVLLSQLNILKKEEIEKARRIARKKKLKELRERRKKEAKRKRLLALKNKKQKNKKVEEEKKEVIKTAETRNQEYANNLSLNVRKIGSSTDGVKIIKYRGKRTIAPLKSFKVVKKFGTYYDPIYKIKLFNESVVLKSKTPKAKVVSILDGKVVYAKNNTGMLENVVIIQHSNGLHTIYSHLDEIAPTLKVGKWVDKGYVVGRIDDSLMFQATKNSSHINPKDLFKL